MKNWRNKQTHESNGSEQFYDLEFDERTIAASIAKTYGILPSEQDDLSISDYFLLISGLDAETPLAYLVRVRREEDPAKIKQMTWEELKIREEWKKHKNNHKKTEVKTEDNKKLDYELGALLQYCNIKKNTA